MREHRFWVRSLDESRVRLETREAHHVKDVLRLSVGDQVVLFDGRGKASDGTVSSLDGDDVWISIGDRVADRESPLQLSVALPPPKGDRMGVAIRMLTELGVQTVIPLVTDRSEWSGSQIARRLDRWQRIALDSCKQSRRSRFPTVTEWTEPRSVWERESSTVLVAHPTSSPLERETVERDQASLIVMIGPEGGWSDEELALAKQQKAHLFSLGPRTLRVESAAVAATSVVQWLAGDWR